MRTPTGVKTWRAVGSSTLAGAVCATALTVAAPAQAALYDSSQWFQADLGFNSKLLCISTCQLYTLAVNRIDYQKSVTNPSGYPRAGERFYMHVQTGIIFPSPVQDSYQMRVLLPAGVKTDVKTETDVQCAITDVADNFTRFMSGAECQDPVQVGLSQQFPLVYLTEGEVAHFFFPVTASGPVNAEVQLTSDLINNPLTVLPDPILSSMQVRVDPAATTDPPATNPPAAGSPSPTPNPSATSPTSPRPLTKPGSASNVTARSKKGKVTLAWRPATGSVTGYRVQAAGKRKFRTIAALPATATSYRWSGGRKSKPYSFRVAATSSIGNGPWSAPVRVKVR